MSSVLLGHATNVGKEDIEDTEFSADLSTKAKSNLTKLAAWGNDRNVPFLVTSIGIMAVCPMERAVLLAALIYLLGQDSCQRQSR